MSDQTTESPVLDLLTAMTAESIEASRLDPEQLMIARLAALVAMDAPPISYMLNLTAAGEVEIDAQQVEGILTAVAPIVGTVRIASAAGKIVRALELEINLAELDEATQN